MCQTIRHLFALTLLGALSVCDAATDGVWVIQGPCLVDAEEPECITSPNYPSNYSAGETCTMHIVDYAPKSLEVMTFNTGRYLDYVTFNSQAFHGLVKDFGDAGDFFVGDLVWESHRRDLFFEKSRGWKLCARDVNESMGTWIQDFEQYTENKNLFYYNQAHLGPWHLTGECEVDAGNLNCVLSPNYPDAPTANSTCSMSLQQRGRDVSVQTLEELYLQWSGVGSGLIFRKSGLRLPGVLAKNMTEDDDLPTFFGAQNYENLTIDWEQQMNVDGVSWRICTEWPPSRESEGDLSQFVGLDAEDNLNGRGLTWPWILAVAGAGLMLFFATAVALIKITPCSPPVGLSKEAVRQAQGEADEEEV